MKIFRFSIFHGLPDVVCGIFCSFLCLPLWGQNLPQPINIDWELGFIINKRCHRYLNARSSNLCKDSVQRMISLLNIKYVNEGSIPWNGDLKPVAFIAFHDEMINLLDQEKTYEYLSLIYQKLLPYKNQQTPLNFNFFELSQQFFQNSQTTLKYIALLFQDTTEVKAHIYYLKNVIKSKTLLMMRNITKLEQILDIFLHIKIYNKAENYFKFFPRNFSHRNLFSSLYHFYVPAYLASLLKSKSFSKTGRVQNEKGAFLSPFMFVLTYEFVTSGKTISMKYIFDDPISLDNQRQKLQDIYTAFVAAYFYSFRLAPSKNFKTFEATMMKSTYSGVRYLLK